MYSVLDHDIAVPRRDRVELLERGSKVIDDFESCGTGCAGHGSVVSSGRSTCM